MPERQSISAVNNEMNEGSDSRLVHATFEKSASDRRLFCPLSLALARQHRRSTSFSNLALLFSGTHGSQHFKSMPLVRWPNGDRRSCFLLLGTNGPRLYKHTFFAAADSSRDFIQRIVEVGVFKDILLFVFRGRNRTQAAKNTVVYPSALPAFCPFTLLAVRVGWVFQNSRSRGGD